MNLAELTAALDNGAGLATDCVNCGKGDPIEWGIGLVSAATTEDPPSVQPVAWCSGTACQADRDEMVTNGRAIVSLWKPPEQPDPAADAVLTGNDVRMIRQKALFGGQVRRPQVVALANEVLRARGKKAPAEPTQGVIEDAATHFECSRRDAARLLRLFATFEPGTYDGDDLDDGEGP